MKFKNYIEVQSGIKDSADSPGTSSQVLTSTATGVAWIDQAEIISGTAEKVSILVKNAEGAALVKGDPVYIIGSVGASARLEVGLCDASDPDKMPCVGLLEQDLLNNGQGNAVTAGKLRNLVTTPIDGQATSENDTIYVKAGGSSGSSLTTTKPTGSTNLIQNVGQVGRVSSSSDGNFVVSAIMRTNDVPNLPEGRIWVGDGNTIVSDTVYIDEPNNRVGIGTTNPGYPLEVAGKIKFTGTGLIDSGGEELVFDANDIIAASKHIQAGYGLWARSGSRSMGIDGSATYMGLYTNTTEKVRITTTGNVGIGTTNPAQLLDVNGIADINSIIIGTNGDNIYHNDSDFYIKTETAHSLIFRTSNVNRLKISEVGNVGIGTTSPTNGKFVIDSTGNQIAIETGTAGDGRLNIGHFSNGTFIGTYGDDGGAADLIRFGTHSGDERMRITSSGNVGIGTTSPGYTLDVNGSLHSTNITIADAIYHEGDTNTYIQFHSNDQWRVVTNGTERLEVNNTQVTVANNLQVNGSIYASQYIYHTGDINTYMGFPSNDTISWNTAGSERMRINSSGNVGIGTTLSGGLPDKVVIKTGGQGVIKDALMLTTGQADNYAGTGVRINMSGVSEANSDIRRSYIESATSSTGNDHYLAFATNSAGSDATEAMRIDSSGNVGIGTTNSVYKLQVYDASSSQVRITNGLPTPVDLQLFASSSSYAGIGTASNHRLAFRTNNTEKVTILANGNVGIGTTSPGSLLSLRREGNGSLFEFNRPASGVEALYGGIVGNDPYFYSNNGIFTLGINNPDGGLGGEVSYITMRNGATRYTTFEAGNVGIGTDSPSTKLEVNNAVQLDSYDSEAIGSNPLESGYLRLLSSSKSGWGNGDELGKIEFYGKDSSGIGPRNAASIKAINSQGNGTTTTTFNGELSFYTSEVNSNEAEAMRIDSSGNVGIGTTNPLQPFQVDAGSSIASFRSVGTGENNKELLIQTGGDRVILDAKNADDGTATSLAFELGNSEKARITTTGNVGIGTTSPSAKLDVAGTVKYNTQLSTNDLMGQKAFIGISSGTGAQKFKIYKNTSTADGYARFKIDRAFDYGNNDQMVQEAIYQRRSTTKNFVFRYDGDTSTSDDVYLEVYELSNGQVEIWLCVDDYAQPVVEVISNPGTSEIFTSPSAGTPTGTLIRSSNPDTETPNWNSHQGAVNISDSLTFTGSGTGSLTAGNGLEEISLNVVDSNDGNNPDNFLISLDNAGSGGFYAKTLELGDIEGVENGTKITINSTDSEIILENGNVGIGTTNPSQKLEVVGISRFTHSSSTSYRGAIETITDNAYPTWDIGWLHARTGSSTYGNVARFNDQSGFQIGAITYNGSAGVSYATTSDYRLKENIEEISDSISRVKKLKPCRFNFAAEKNRVVDGFIAHEVQEVVPEAVHGEKDALQEDGSIDAQTLEVSRLIPVLTKALQEAIAKIEQLETRIQTLENK